MKSRENAAPEYAVWAMARQRCHLSTNKNFHQYGGRGIVMCDSWRESFAVFIADMGRRPPGTTLERIDGTKGYEPGNCRWATWTEQQRNRRDNVYLTLNGERLPAREWAARIGIGLQAIYARRCLGWSDERILTQPLRTR